jgi:hypothetical protein
MLAAGLGAGNGHLCSRRMEADRPPDGGRKFHIATLLNELYMCNVTRMDEALAWSLL